MFRETILNNCKITLLFLTFSPMLTWVGFQSNQLRLELEQANRELHSNKEELHALYKYYEAISPGILINERSDEIYRTKRSANGLTARRRRDSLCYLFGSDSNSDQMETMDTEYTFLWKHLNELSPCDLDTLLDENMISEIIIQQNGVYFISAQIIMAGEDITSLGFQVIRNRREENPVALMVTKTSPNWPDLSEGKGNVKRTKHPLYVGGAFMLGRGDKISIKQLETNIDGAFYMNKSFSFFGVVKLLF